MARILEIQKKSNAYINSLKENIVRVVESNAPDMISLNRVQMFNSKDAEDNPLVNKRTGSEYLSMAYAKRTGKSKPNLFLQGDFQSSMLFFMPSDKEYFLASKDSKSGILSKNYGKIFGVAPTNQPKAKEINTKAIVEDYLKIFK